MHLCTVRHAVRGARYRDVIEHCNEVLRREAGNVKALFRRSKAYEQVGDLRAALSDAKEAAAKEPDNVHVQRRVSQPCPARAPCVSALVARALVRVHSAVVPHT